MHPMHPSMTFPFTEEDRIGFATLGQKMLELSFLRKIVFIPVPQQISLSVKL